MWATTNNISRMILMGVGSEASPCCASLVVAGISAFCRFDWIRNAADHIESLLCTISSEELTSAQ